PHAAARLRPHRAAAVPLHCRSAVAGVTATERSAAMPILTELEATAERARTAMEQALGRAEHSPLTRAIEAYARARALLFAHILIEQLRQRLITAPPASTGELLAVLDATLVAAVETYGEAVGSRGWSE